MATTETTIDVPRERVFGVLARPEAYADWVVGSDLIRDADASWPATGSRFHHRVGFGPFKVKDHTEVIEVQPPGKLVMHARARPLGTALVTVLLEAQGDSTRVTMHETAGDALSRLAINPLTDWLVHHRNVESLRRLKRIAETGVLEP
ncbi:MAG: SRPBCC family protein [Solirubrobacteraceae bacterium]